MGSSPCSLTGGVLNLMFSRTTRMVRLAANRSCSNTVGAISNVAKKMMIAYRGARRETISLRGFSHARYARMKAAIMQPQKNWPASWMYPNSQSRMPTPVPPNENDGTAMERMRSRLLHDARALKVILPCGTGWRKWHKCFSIRFSRSLPLKTLQRNTRV